MNAGGWESCLASSKRKPLWEVTFSRFLKHAVELSGKRMFQSLGTDMHLDGEMFQSEEEPRSKTLPKSVLSIFKEEQEDH